MSSSEQTNGRSRPDAFFKSALDELKRAGLLRELRDLKGAPGPYISVHGRHALLLCSNNYLGISGDERLKLAAAEALEKWGTGATGSRLISGNLEPYDALERELAEFKGAESALIFTSGFQANLGTVAALVGEG